MVGKMTIQRGDWVRRKDSRHAGIVILVALDGSWADVDWLCGRTRVRTDTLEAITRRKQAEGRAANQ